MALPDIEYVVFPRSVVHLFGQRAPGYRIYSRSGGIDDYRSWVHALAEHVGLVLSSGEAATYLGITRAAVWRRMNQGKLTTFNFYLAPIEVNGDLVVKSLDACVPLKELRQWHDFRQARKDELERLDREEEEQERAEDQRRVLEEEERERRMEEEETEEEKAIREDEEKMNLERIEFEKSLLEQQQKKKKQKAK